MAVNKIPDAQPVLALGPKEIIKLAGERISAYAERNASYENFLEYYLGKQSGSGATLVQPMNGYGKPVLRQIGSNSGGERRYISNRLQPIVDDYTALLGRLPIVRVDTPDSSDAAESKAILETKYLYSTYKLSQMEHHQGEMGFFLSCFGDGVYIQSVDFDLKRVVMESLDPRYVYPSFWRGYRRFEVYDAVVAYQWNSEDIKREFDYSPKDDGPDSVVTMYVSPHQRTVLVGADEPEVVAHVEWNLDHAPVQWVFNKTNGNFANSDIAASLPQQDFLDHLNTIAADAAVFATYPIIGVKNAYDMGEGAMEIGPGATVNLGENGEIQVVGPQVRLEAFQQLSQKTEQEMLASAGSSQVRMDGQGQGSIVTGRALQAMQGPQSTRLDLKRQILGAALERANAQILMMQEKAPFLGTKEIEIDGRYKGQSFVEKFQGDRDIDGWYRNTVTFDDLIGVNQQQKLSLAFEGMQAKLWDDLTAREIVGEDDPMGMREKIRNQMIWEAKLQQEVAQGAQSQDASFQMNSNGATSQPQMAFKPAVMRPATMMNAGAPAGGAMPPPTPPGAGVAGGPMASPVGATPPAPAPGGPPALPTGVAMGVSRKAVAAALQGVKLRGTVFATGDLADRGQADKVTLAISDFRDQRAVREAVQPLDDKPTIRTYAEGKMPSGAVRIA